MREERRDRARVRESERERQARETLLLLRRVCIYYIYVYNAGVTKVIIAGGSEEVWAHPRSILTSTCACVIVTKWREVERSSSSSYISLYTAYVIAPAKADASSTDEIMMNTRAASSLMSHRSRFRLANGKEQV